MSTKLLIPLIVLTPYFAKGQSPSFFEDYLQKWDNGIAFTLELATAMPSDQFHFKPTSSQMSFQQQLIHTMENMLWISGDYLGGTSQSKPSVEEAEDLNKEELLILFQEVGRYVHQTVAAIKPEELSEPVKFFTKEVRNKGQLLMLMQDHHTHHRGQLIVYLRLNDIQPPRYRGW